VLNTGIILSVNYGVPEFYRDFEAKTHVTSVLCSNNKKKTPNLTASATSVAPPHMRHQNKKLSPPIK